MKKAFLFFCMAFIAISLTAQTTVRKAVVEKIDQSENEYTMSEVQRIYFKEVSGSKLGVVEMKAGQEVEYLVDDLERIYFKEITEGSVPTLALNEVFLYSSEPSDKQWIEIRNNGSTDADISGYIITSNKVSGAQLTIPASTTIAAGSVYIVESTESFIIPKEVNTIYLQDASNNILDQIRVAYTFQDASYGRYTDGDSKWAWFIGKGTKGSSNNGQPLFFCVNEIKSWGDKFVEYFNPNPVNVDLTNYWHTGRNSDVTSGNVSRIKDAPVGTNGATATINSTYPTQGTTISILTANSKVTFPHFTFPNPSTGANVLMLNLNVAQGNHPYVGVFYYIETPEEAETRYFTGAQFKSKEIITVDVQLSNQHNNSYSSGRLPDGGDWSSEALTPTPGDTNVIY